MIRQGYFDVRAGNLDETNVILLLQCLDYLRQAILCAGDTTLEWARSSYEEDDFNGFGFEHQCKDYAEIRNWAEQYTDS